MRSSDELLDVHCMQEDIKEIKEKDLDITATKRDIKELELRLKIHLGAMIFSLLLAFKILDKFL